MEFLAVATVGLVVLFMVASMWRIFTKAGEAGWKCLMPLYGAVVLQRILGRPGWWVLLLLIPVVNIIPAIIECFDLAKVFGKGAGYAWGLILLPPVFIAMLAWGSADYRRPGRTDAAPAPMRRAA